MFIALKTKRQLGFNHELMTKLLFLKIHLMNHKRKPEIQDGYKSTHTMSQKTNQRKISYILNIHHVSKNISSEVQQY